MKHPERNPQGIRTVTVIVTHEDEAKDFSKTFTSGQIVDTACMDVTRFESKIRTDWHMTTLEDRK